MHFFVCYSGVEGMLAGTEAVLLEVVLCPAIQAILLGLVHDWESRLIYLLIFLYAVLCSQKVRFPGFHRS